MIGRHKFLIVTADDFGLHEALNEAVQQAAAGGVLSAASLMMAAPATADAVSRARHLPRLRVGLHLVLADGAAMLPPPQLPDLLDAQGRFGTQMFTWPGHSEICGQTVTPTTTRRELRPSFGGRVDLAQEGRFPRESCLDGRRPRPSGELGTCGPAASSVRWT